MTLCCFGFALLTAQAEHVDQRLEHWLHLCEQPRLEYWNRLCAGDLAAALSPPALARTAPVRTGPPNAAAQPSQRRLRAEQRR